MEFEAYCNLTDEEQFDILWDRGGHLHTIETPEGQYQLFSLFRFYVELVLPSEGGNVQRLSPFTYGKRLDKYPLDLRKVKKPWE